MPFTELIELDNMIFKIEIGRNASENDQLVREPDKNSLWFHVDNMPSSHGILSVQASNNTPLNKLDKFPKKLIHKCATLVKNHSKAVGLCNINVNYIQRKYVHTTDVLGRVRLSKKPKSILVKS